MKLNRVTLANAAFAYLIIETRTLEQGIERKTTKELKMYIQWTMLYG